MNRAELPNLLFAPTWTPGPRARAPYAPSIPTGTWDGHRAEIVEMYIDLNWRLDDVMRVMETYNFFATKRQYTKKLKDWGCKKYNVQSKDDAPTEPALSAPETPFQLADDGSPVAPGELVGTALSENSTRRHKDMGSLIGTAISTDLAITNNTNDAEDKVTTAQEFIAILRGGHNPGTENTGERSRGLSFDVDAMDVVPKCILEERSASPSSRFGRRSIEDTSLRDYDSVSIVSLGLGHPVSPSTSALSSAEVVSSPPPIAAPATVLTDPQLLNAVQDTNAAEVDPDWDVTRTISIVGLPLDAAPLAGIGSYAHPALARPEALTRVVSPTWLLLMIESGRVSGKLSKADILRIEQLAELFECARSYDDAYQLRRLVHVQDVHAIRSDSASQSPAWQCSVVKVVRNANKAGDYKESAAFVKQAWKDNPLYLDELSMTGILQQSHLGGMFRARLDFASAEIHSQRAVDRMLAFFDREGVSQSQAHSGQSSGAWLAVITNFVLTREAKEKMVSGDAWRGTDALRSHGLVVPDEMGERSQLLQVVGWCIDALSEDSFRKMLLPVTPDLWLLASKEADLRVVEGTLLFFYLWSQMQPSPNVTQRLVSDSVESRSNCVLGFAYAWGISVTEVLSVVASYIIATNTLHQAGNKSTLARRAFTSARAVYNSLEGKASHLDMRVDFMEAYVAIRRQKEKGFDAAEYATLVRAAVRDFVQRNFHLELEVSAFRDPRLQYRLSQASMAPSCTPTMLSTPRSSWSGFRSFKSVGRRASKLWTNNNSSSNDVQSLLSSRRWSGASSMKSALTQHSTTASVRDVIMEDE